MNKSNFMAKESISRLLIKFSMPAIIGLLVNALYNIIDSMFVGRGVGELALAGVTVCFPIVTSFVAFIMLVGMGATSLISIRLGENRKEDAEKIIANAFLILLVLGSVLTILGLIFLRPILSLFGASPDVMPYSLDYMRIILLGTVFLAIGTGMNNFIRAEGQPKIAMNTMLIGTIANIILDYIFIFIFDWGIKGAAAATIISYGVTSIKVLSYFISGRGILKLHIINFRIEKSIFKKILSVGFPTFIIQVTGSIQQLILNRKLVQYGGDMALAVIGIIMSITTFLVMPAMGIAQGTQPIIGFNFGSKNLKRVKSTLKQAIIWTTAIITVGLIISKIWPAQMIGLFNDNSELISLGVYAMDIFFKFIPLVGLQMLSTSYFQAVGKPNQATLLGLSRQVIIFIPLLIILPHFWGIKGVWWSAPLSDLGAFLLTGAWLWIEFTHLEKVIQDNHGILSADS